MCSILTQISKCRPLQLIYSDQARMLRFWKGTLFISTGALQGDIGIYEGCGQITFVASVEYQTYAIILSPYGTLFTSLPATSVRLRRLKAVDTIGTQNNY